MTFAWLPLAIAVPGFFVWAAAHEGAHALAGAVTGLRVQSFKPWPHRTAAGRFVFAGLSFDREPGAAVHVAPFVVDVLVAAAALAALLVVELPAGGAWALAGAAVLPTVDLVVGVLGRYRGVNPTTDLSRVGWGAAVPFFAAALAACVAWGAALARLFS